MAEINKIWMFNGHEFPLDMDDTEVLERYDAAVLAMREAFRELPLNATDARQIVAYCAGVRAMIDTLCGEGTTTLLIGESKRPSDFDVVYESLIDFVHEQTDAAYKHRLHLLNKYKPNREQRRNMDKK